MWHSGTSPRSPQFLISSPRCTTVHEDADACEFQIGWEINAHMHKGSVTPELAQHEHQRLREVVLAAGATLVDVPFVHGAYDSVFVKDNALLVDDRALLATPRHKERKQEQLHRRVALRALGFDVEDPLPVSFEGGDVVRLPWSGDALLGYGQRSAVSAAPLVAEFLNADVTPIELRDPFFYHLDTAVSVLSDGTAFVAQGALTADGKRTLKHTAGIEQVIEVPRADALGFALNMVQIGDRVILGRASNFLERIFNTLGFRATVVPLDEFQRAGGSVSCLLAPVHESPRKVQTFPSYSAAL